MENIQEKIEDKIIDWIALGGDGRIVAFKPEALKSVLVVKKRGDYKGDYKSKELYFKVISFIESPENKVFIKDFSGQDLTLNKNLYLLFVSFDEISQKINDKFWMIPSLQFKKSNFDSANPEFSKFLTSQKIFIDFLIEQFLKK